MIVVSHENLMNARVLNIHSEVWKEMVDQLPEKELLLNINSIVFWAIRLGIPLDMLCDRFVKLIPHDLYARWNEENNQSAKNEGFNKKIVLNTDNEVIKFLKWWLIP